MRLFVLKDLAAKASRSFLYEKSLALKLKSKGFLRQFKKLIFENVTSLV